MSWFQIYFEFWYSPSIKWLNQKFKKTKFLPSTWKKICLTDFSVCSSRPWDPLLDLHQYEHDFVIQTNLRQQGSVFAALEPTPSSSSILDPCHSGSGTVKVTSPRHLTHRRRRTPLNRRNSDSSSGRDETKDRSGIDEGPYQMISRLIDWWTVDTSIIWLIDWLIDLLFDWLIDRLLLSRFLLWFLVQVRKRPKPLPWPPRWT